MKTIETIEAMRRQTLLWRSEQLITALVPTMGNLHEGHLSLVKQAHQHADKVIVSIFVNPTQFGPGEDFDAYPRTEQQDLEKLDKIGADCVFLPNVEEIYGQDTTTRIEVAGLSDLHCGQSRPGHFSGVATIVCKLFNIIPADIAVFGRKDYQQLAVIKAMVKDLNVPVQLIGIDTVREPDGLAMSSRNAYLTEQQRSVAPQLFNYLKQAKAAILSGESDFPSLAERMTEQLNQTGFNTDYFNICYAANLLPAHDFSEDLVILAAAHLGRARLIDNLEIPFEAYTKSNTKTNPLN